MNGRLLLLELSKCPFAPSFKPKVTLNQGACRRNTTGQKVQQPYSQQYSPDGLSCVLHMLQDLHASF